MISADLSNQINIFILSYVFGILIGLIYDIFKCFRIIGFSKNYMILIEDILFMLILGIATFFLSLSFNDGKIRLYIVFSEFISMIIYKITISKLLIYIFMKILIILNKIKQIIMTILKPISSFLNKNLLFILSNTKIFLNSIKNILKCNRALVYNIFHRIVKR